MTVLTELADYCAKVFAEELGKDLNKEQSIKGYLPQEAFPDYRSRMKSLRYNATRRVDNLLELLNLKHRSESHEEDNTIRIAQLEAGMSKKDLEASTRIWWMA